MAAFFQAVGLNLLLTRAHKHKFHMPLVRLAIAMYIGPLKEA